jgi:ribosomal-protein-alanine N-acetyltransferase
VYTIRRVQPEDIFAVIKIAYQCLPEQYPPIIFNHFLESFPQGFLIAEYHHHIIGFISGLPTHEKHNRILMLAVREHHRKKGAGTALLSNYMENMKTMNISLIQLEVRTSNTTAIAFYKKNGFNIMETMSKFYNNGEDAYLMQRKL